MTLQDYLTYFEEIMKPTEELFRMIPEEKIDWKPTEHSFTLGQQIAHMSAAIGVYASGIARGEWGFKSMREIFVQNRYQPSITAEEAILLFKKNRSDFRKTLSALSEEEFANGEVDTPQLGRVPRWRIALLALEHHINHKAELFMSLKMLGVKVNTSHLYFSRK
jgi:uncharacterized damage-inducible protein DinB